MKTFTQYFACSGAFPNLPFPSVSSQVANIVTGKEME